MFGTCTLLAAAMGVVAAPKVSDATYLRSGMMTKAPVIDGRISFDEDHSASVHYGFTSEKSGLIALRFSVGHFGWTERGFYFATRTSVPMSPIALGDKDAVTLKLLPPNAKKPIVLRLGLKDGEGNLPAGSEVKTCRLDGISDYGYLCMEAEMFVPYAALGISKPKDNERWGMQMLVDYGSPNETCYWHYNKNDPEEMGTFVPDSKSIVPGFVHFGPFETYRDTGWYKILFRFDNSTSAAVRLEADKSIVYHGIGFAKLDSNEEIGAETASKRIADLFGAAIPANDTKDIIFDLVPIWPGTVNIMNLDVNAGGKPLYRRHLRWDVAKGERWKDVEGLPNMQCGFYPSDGNRLRVNYGVNKIKDMVRGAVRVIDSAGKTHFEKVLKGPNIWGCNIDTRLPDLPLGDYRVIAAGATADGRKYKVERTFSLKKFPWQDLNIGKDRIILPPFKEIKVENQDPTTISFLQTGYRCKGVLWDEIYAQGKNILAGPVTLKLNGQEFTVVSSKIVEKSPDRVIREVSAVLTPSQLSQLSQPLNLLVTQTYDYDGFCWITLEFDAPQPVKVNSLTVYAPLKNELAKLFEVLRRNDQREKESPDFTLKEGEGEVWNSLMNVRITDMYKREHEASVQPYVWFGGAYKGLSFLRNTMRGWSVCWEKPTERIVRRNGAAVLEADFVNSETTWEGKHTFTMGFQPTPVKPRDWNCAAFAFHMYSYTCPSNAVGMWCMSHSGQMPVLRNTENCVYPNNDTSLRDWAFAAKKKDTKAYLKKLDEYIERNSEWIKHYGKGLTPTSYRQGLVNSDRQMGLKYHFYYMDPCLISCHWPEFEMYKGDWYVEQWPREYLCNEYLGRPSPSRIDKILYDGRRALRSGFDGIYYDCFMLQGDYNFASSGGRAYFAKDGSRRPHLGNLMEWRDLVRRTATMSFVEGKKVFGKGYCEVHTTDGLVVPVNSFGVNALGAERGTQGGDYQDRFKESYVLADVIGTQAGCAPRILVTTIAGDEKRKERELKSLMAFMCAYGIFALEDEGTIYRSWFEKAWNIVFDFGWGRDEVTPHFYYDETPAPVKHTGKDVRLTVAAKKDSALLMFGNLGEAAEFDIDLSGLGFKVVKIADAETGEEIKANHLKIDRHGYRLIRVN